MSAKGQKRSLGHVVSLFHHKLEGSVATPDRLPWKFDENVHRDRRGDRALEYIANYLDRIDQHLEVVAEALQAGNSQASSIATNLMSINHSIQKRR